MDMQYGEFLISDDKELLQLNRVYELLEATYWAKGRSIASVCKSVENSLCFGVYFKEKQVGFARCVTDYATIYWLADVVIDDNYKKQGLGKALMEAVVCHEELRHLKGILATDDAHGLYERYGFELENGRFMSKKPCNTEK